MIKPDPMLDRRYEIEFYEQVYLLAFGKDKFFFYHNDTADILAFLEENFFGDNLHFKIRLLAKLLYYDSFVNMSIQKTLQQKSKALLGSSQLI